MNYDAIIIGGRVAGSATALLLARRGYRVLMVDRAKFPSDTISTHLIWQRGVAYLTEWGLGDHLAALNAPPMRIAEFDVGPFKLSGTPPPVRGAKDAYGPRRTLLDKMLRDAAERAGAELREGFTVDDFLFDGERMTGIVGHTKSVPAVTENAKVVIGADGVHSSLAARVQAPEYNVHPRLIAWYYTYWSGIRSDRLRMFSRPGTAFGCLPTCDDLVCVPVAFPRSRFAEVKRNLESHYLASFDAAPSFKQEIMDARREEKFYGTADIPNYFRKPYGDGWALVGDAGYHKDPILAQGISDALEHSSMLAAALHNVFARGVPWETALSNYERARNASVSDIYSMNAQLATLSAPDREMQDIMSALQGNQRDTDNFLGTMSGAVSVSDFYAPANTQRILAKARVAVASAA